MTASPPPSVEMATPNEYVRRLRNLFVQLVAGSIAIVSVAFMMLVNRWGPQFLSVILMLVGMLGLLGARFVKSAAACPQCANALLWRKGPFGTGRLSLSLKDRCQQCGLDLNAPMPINPPGDT